MLTKIMQFCIPEIIKKKMLDELFRLTADAFQSEMPELRGLSFSGRLQRYAVFSGEQAERCLKGGKDGRLPEEVRERLYENSFTFGKNLRKRLHIMSWEESVKVLTSIYKFIGIDFQYGGQNGTAADGDGFEIRKCFFSSYYSEEVCRLISSLDEGLAAGLTGIGILCFSQRITGGSSSCKGCLKQGDLE